jgi:hypothetical protein
MKKQILSFLLLIFLAFGAAGQNDGARLVDEFENTNCCDYRARLDLLLSELNKSPQSKGYVFVYEGDLRKIVYDKNYRAVGDKYVPSEKGTGRGLLGYFRGHLLFRKFPAERIVFIEAGFREKFAVELWIVPDGSAPPEPSPTLKKIKQQKAKKSPFGFCGEI